LFVESVSADWQTPAPVLKKAITATPKCDDGGDGKQQVKGV